MEWPFQIWKSDHKLKLQPLSLVHWRKHVFHQTAKVAMTPFKHVFLFCFLESKYDQQSAFPLAPLVSGPMLLLNKATKDKCAKKWVCHLKWSKSFIFQGMSSTSHWKKITLPTLGAQTHCSQKTEVPEVLGWSPAAEGLQAVCMNPALWYHTFQMLCFRYFKLLTLERGTQVKN